MHRRSFLKKSALATAGLFAAPYLLPSGRLFAASGLRKVNHVVFCLYAGGVRNLESVHMNDGNLMPAMFSGGGSISPDIIGGMEALPSSPLGLPLQSYGTLFKEFRYRFGPTGHYNGHTVAVTGNYVDVDLNLREHPRNPTIFEYYRKHNSPQQTAMNCWWVANTLGPYPALNYSTNNDYGAAYGANFIAPTALISPQGFDVLGNPRTFSSNEEAAITNMRDFTNGIFNHTYSDGSAGVTNNHADAVLLQQFITDLYTKAQSSAFLNSWGVGQNIMNNDMYNILFANEIIKTFKPELLVVNMQDVDVCHFQYTEYATIFAKPITPWLSFGTRFNLLREWRTTRFSLLPRSTDETSIRIHLLMRSAVLLPITQLRPILISPAIRICKWLVKSSASLSDRQMLWCKIR
ncbi:MAG: twin-arginine translocation signal domain-containing protein [Bacteroidetes bacterium]|nr:twin-arginine translocation signal domain-containing protein [Bacteroidota bacterium]